MKTKKIRALVDVVVEVEVEVRADLMGDVFIDEAMDAIEMKLADCIKPDCGVQQSIEFTSVDLEEV